MKRLYLQGEYFEQVTSLIGSLMRFSSNKDEVCDASNDIRDGSMPEMLSKKLEVLAGQTESQSASHTDFNHLSLDDLSKISRSMLMDENLEVSKVRPFFWNLVEAYVERFQVFPFDAGKALFSYLELQDYPEGQMRDLVNKLEMLYEKRYGQPMRESEQQLVTEDIKFPTLDDEINELRETLKYAAIVGERLDGKE